MVYASGNIPVATLQAYLQTRGWQVFFASDDGSLDPFDGVSIGDSVALGWHVSSSDSELVSDCLFRKNEPAVNALYDQDTIGSVAIFVDNNYKANPAALDEMKRISKATDKVIDRVSRSDLQYTLRTAAGRNALSLQLQEEIWRSLGSLTEGVLENPQTGKLLTSKMA